MYLEYGGDGFAFNQDLLFERNKLFFRHFRMVWNWVGRTVDLLTLPFFTFHPIEINALLSSSYFLGYRPFDVCWLSLELDLYYSRLVVWWWFYRWWQVALSDFGAYG
jgi:hypothetical protein